MIFNNNNKKLRNSASSLHFAARGKKLLTMRYKASQCCNRGTKLAPISNFLFRNRAPCSVYLSYIRKEPNTTF